MAATPFDHTKLPPSVTETLNGATTETRDKPHRVGPAPSGVQVAEVGRDIARGVVDLVVDDLLTGA